MKLYGNSASPYVRKTLAFAAEKGMALELVAAGMGGGPPEFRLASPFGKMPAFQDGDFMLADSTAIITYLDAVQPEPYLIPTEPKARARTIWFEEFADTMMVATIGKMFFNRFVAPRVMGREGDLAAADAAEATELPPILDYLEGQIPASGFLIEDRLTLADLAVASPFQNLALIGVKPDAARYPKVAAHAAAILARPSFAGWCEQEFRMFGVERA
ncbi:MAG: glutathione S-transferase family protein [Phenylobacterium sp.]|uniref:glutathione S-transferase family protein n=1 Tax=Phenylobacterium sp. TaxID=1871053 RepID=UPI001A39800C|nr:glutathione S-transferase family protein [Phenylobacterium sp.]MBL8773976.1 glutathione S-transferase family protein [Phenylobacterium sp.]